MNRDLKLEWRGNEIERSWQKKAMPDKDEPHVTEFNDSEDFILTMILVGIMHSNPGVSSKDAVKLAKDLARKLSMPNSEHLWRRQTDKIERIGMSAQASKIRREMYKLI